MVKSFGDGVILMISFICLHCLLLDDVTGVPKLPVQESKTSDTDIPVFDDTKDDEVAQVDWTMSTFFGSGNFLDLREDGVYVIKLSWGAIGYFQLESIWFPDPSDIVVLKLFNVYQNLFCCIKGEHKIFHLYLFFFFPPPLLFHDATPKAESLFEEEGKAAIIIQKKWRAWNMRKRFVALIKVQNLLHPHITTIQFGRKLLGQGPLTLVTDKNNPESLGISENPTHNLRATNISATIAPTPNSLGVQLHARISKKICWCFLFNDLFVVLVLMPSLQ